MLWPNPTQSSQGTGSEVRSRAASQAPAQEEFKHLPNQFKHLPNQFNYLLNPIGYLLNPLQQAPEFVVVQLEHLPNQLNQLPKSSSRQFSGSFLGFMYN